MRNFAACVYSFNILNLQVLAVENKHIIRIIFGLKLKQLRQQRNLSFADLSKKSGLSISYLNEIEKGKKYPKAEKIMDLAEALETNYDELISLKLNKKLQPVSDLLNSNFLNELPLDLFGLELNTLLELITHAPSRFNAFINTLIEIARNYEVEQEQFYFAALRSYQELNENYFEEIEDSVEEFCKTNELEKKPPVGRNQLYWILSEQYGYLIDKNTLGEHEELKNVRSVFNQSRRKLYINNSLSETQKAFLLGRELAFNFLKLEIRPFYTPFLRVSSFEEALNNFKASYFSVGLLLSKEYMLEDLRGFFDRSKWSSEEFIGLLDRYHASPEMFIQRLTNLLPRHFNISNLFMLRFHHDFKEDKFRITKELHLSGKHTPHANEINEHYCRRWVSIQILKDLHKKQEEESHEGFLADIQISNYPDSNRDYLCISVARPNLPTPNSNVSVTLGLFIDSALRKKINFHKDPAIQAKKVNTTCERCPIMDCQERAAPPYTMSRKRGTRGSFRPLNH